MDQAICAKPYILSLFRSVIPSASSTSSTIPSSKIQVSSKIYSFNPDFFPDVDSELSPFDMTRTASILHQSKFAPRELLSAETVRTMFEWMGCVRALVTRSHVVLEFLDDASCQAMIHQMHSGMTLDSLVSRMESLSFTEAMDGNGMETNGTVVGNTSYAGLFTNPTKARESDGKVVHIDKNTRKVSKIVTTFTTVDLSMPMRLLPILAAGQKHTWSSCPRVEDAAMKEEGVDLGKVLTAFTLNFVKKNHRIPIKPYWRAPVSDSTY
jgi:hypothetical protein